MMRKQIANPTKKYPDLKIFLCGLRSRKNRRDANGKMTEYLLRKANPETIHIQIHQEGLFILTILKKRKMIRSQKNCSKAFGVNSESKIRKPPEIKNAVEAMISAA